MTPFSTLSMHQLAYAQLVTFKRRRCLQQEDWDSPVLLRLHSRVEDMVLKGQLGARQTANVLWRTLRSCLIGSAFRFSSWLHWSSLCPVR